MYVSSFLIPLFVGLFLFKQKKLPGRWGRFPGGNSPNVAMIWPWPLQTRPRRRIPPGGEVSSESSWWSKKGSKNFMVY